jgi:hypothetical protein
MTLLPQWSVVFLINPRRQKTMIHTDVSGIKGIGGWWESQAFPTHVLRNNRSKLIDWKEAYAVVFTFAKWGHLWRGHTIIIMCDNAVVVNAMHLYRKSSLDSSIGKASDLAFLCQGSSTKNGSHPTPCFSNPLLLSCNNRLCEAHFDR